VRPSQRLLLQAARVAFLATVVALLCAAPADADPLDDIRTREGRVEREVRLLDERTAEITEEYNRARWQAGVMRRQVARSTRELREARRDLARGRELLGARSLGDVTDRLDTRARLDAAVAQTVEQVEAAGARIAVEREAFQAAAHRAEVESEIMPRTRRRIQSRLERRERLLAEIGLRRGVLEAEAAIGESLDPDEARAWLEADMRLNRDQPETVLGDRIALEALDQLGVPYLWGGASPKGFDCSGLITWLWAQHGHALPHHAATQYRTAGAPVAKEDLRPGDLVSSTSLATWACTSGTGT
jgi:cell wall-associated NlpC family hydrolase